MIYARQTRILSGVRRSRGEAVTGVNKEVGVVVAWQARGGRVKATVETGEDRAAPDREKIRTPRNAGQTHAHGTMRKVEKR